MGKSKVIDTSVEARVYAHRRSSSWTLFAKTQITQAFDAGKQSQQDEINDLKNTIEKLKQQIKMINPYPEM